MKSLGRLGILWRRVLLKIFQMHLDQWMTRSCEIQSHRAMCKKSPFEILTPVYRIRELTKCDLLAGATKKQICKNQWHVHFSKKRPAYVFRIGQTIFWSFCIIVMDFGFKNIVVIHSKDFAFPKSNQFGARCSISLFKLQNVRRVFLLVLQL